MTTLDQDTDLQPVVAVPVRTGAEMTASGTEDYSRHVVGTNIPHIADGLKRGSLRSILVCGSARYEKGKLIKASNAVGDIQNLHNHGITSIYDHIVRLCQPWHYAQPYFILEGNRGSYSDEDGYADYRYTDLRLTPFAHDIYLDIDPDTLPRARGSDLTGIEPHHFSPPIPMTLINGNITIGYGYQSRIPQRNLADVIDVTCAYLKHMNTNILAPFPIEKYIEKLLPDFPIANTITNVKELIAAYKAGKWEHPIMLEGDCVLTQHTINIYAVPYGTQFAPLRELLIDKLNKKSKLYDSWFENVIEGMPQLLGGKNVRPGLRINIKKTVNVFDVWERISRAIGFSGSFVPHLNFVDDKDRLYIGASPNLLLHMWFEARSTALESTKRRELARANDECRVAEAMLIVRDHADEIIALVSGHTGSNEELILEIRKRYRLTYYQASQIEAKATLFGLSRTNREKLVEIRDKAYAKRTAIQAAFNQIVDLMIERAQSLKKRYGTPRQTILPNYIGYVAVDGGCIQFERVEDIDGIITGFPKGDLKIHFYDGSHVVWVPPSGKAITNQIPRIVRGDIYGLPCHPEKAWTVNFSDGGEACCVPRFIPGSRDRGYEYTTSKSYVVRRNGLVQPVKIGDVISKRKNIGLGAKTDIIHVYPHTTDVHYVLVASDATPNEIRLRRIAQGGGAAAMVLPIDGKLHIVHHYTGNDWFFSLPPGCLNRINARGFIIRNANELLGGDDSVVIEIGTARWKRHANFQIIPAL